MIHLVRRRKRGEDVVSKRRTISSGAYHETRPRRYNDANDDDDDDDDNSNVNGRIGKKAGSIRVGQWRIRLVIVVVVLGLLLLALCRSPPGSEINHGSWTNVTTVIATSLAQHVISPPHVNQAKCPSLLEETYRNPSVIKNASLSNIQDDFTTTTSFLTANQKPYLILHIGPSKTGTTTLQKDSERLQGELQKDGLVYVGRYARRSLREPARIPELFSNDDCLREVAGAIHNVSQSSAAGWDASSSSLPECWKNRTKGIRDLYHARNISIIISDERYSYERFMISICNDPNYISTLVAALRQDWNLMVVATYRRFAEWLLSAAKEVNQKVCHNPQRPEGQWDGEKCWSLWRLVKLYQATPTGDAFSYMNLDTTVPAWRKQGIPVQILNLHNSNQSLTTSLYCDVIPTAPHVCYSCRKASQHGRNITRENVQSVMTTAYNDIVYDAFQAGLVHPPLVSNATRMTRQQFVSSLAYQGATMGLQMTDLPLLCPRQSDLEALLQKSLTMEDILWGSNVAREIEHRRDFWRLAEERKEFCRVNTKQLLHRKLSWEEVVEHLRHLAGTRSSSELRIL